jgi:hypothetical protein
MDNEEERLSGNEGACRSPEYFFKGMAGKENPS